MGYVMKYLIILAGLTFSAFSFADLSLMSQSNVALSDTTTEDDLKFTYHASVLDMARSYQPNKKLTVDTAKLDCRFYNTNNEQIVRALDTQAVLSDELFNAKDLSQTIKNFAQGKQKWLHYEMSDFIFGDALLPYDANQHPYRQLYIELINAIEFPKTLTNLPKSDYLNDPMIEFLTMVTLKENDTIINQEILTAKCGFYR